jgi:peptidoglycan/LPS O-acetylase OafA/YrhL
VDTDINMTLESSSSNKKIGSVNMLRFIAAMFVLFYHFSFVFYYAKTTFVDMPIFRYLFQYGYLGVELFFIISGFVISMSAENRNAYGFLKSRLGRLYPIFWVSIIITSIFIIFKGDIINSNITWTKFLANLTMIPQVVNQTYIDPSYWTLVVEMKFYFFILLLLLFKQFKRIEFFSIVTSILITLGILFFDMPIMWPSYFLAGIIFYKIYKEGLNNWRIFGLCNTFFISIYFALARIPNHEANFIGTDFKPSIIVSYILLYYIIFLMISLNRFKIHNNKYINILGLITFPLYLLHQQISRILFTYANIKDVPLYISFPSIIIFILIISFLIHRIFERHGKIFIDKVLDRITPGFIKNL